MLHQHVSQMHSRHHEQKRQPTPQKTIHHIYLCLLVISNVFLGVISRFPLILIGTVGKYKYVSHMSAICVHMQTITRCFQRMCCCFVFPEFVEKLQVTNP